MAGDVKQQHIEHLPCSEFVLLRTSVTVSKTPTNRLNTTPVYEQFF